MSRYAGRHTGKTTTSTGVIVLVIAAAAAALIAAAYFVSRPYDSGASRSASAVAAGSTGDATQPAAAGAPACAQPVAVGAAAGLVPALRAAADAYNAAGTGCVSIVERSDSSVFSGTVQDLAAWVPGDASVFALAPEAVRAKVTGSPTAFARTPVVLLQQEQVAKALDTDLLSALPAFLDVSKTWEDYGHASWGRFRFVLPDPATSPAGAAGFGSLALRTGGGALPTGDLATATPEQIKVALLEYRVAQTVPTEYDVFTALGRLDVDATGYSLEGPRAAVTTEYAAIRNAANGGPKMTGQRLDPAASVTYAIGALGPEQAEEVSDFASFLTSSAGAETLGKAGLHAGTSVPAAAQVASAGLAAGATAGAATGSTAAAGEVPTTANDPKAMATYAGLFEKLRTRVSTILALDMSGSMKEKFAGTQTRFDLIRQMAAVGFDQSPPRARFGLVTFQTTGEDFTQKVQELIPLRINTDPANAKDLTLYQRTLQQAVPDGGTPLFNAIQYAMKRAEEQYDPAYANRILVITDGANRDVKNSISLETLLADLKDKDPSRPVGMTLVALGPEADYATLKKIGDATGSTVAWAKTPFDLPKVAQVALYYSE